MVYYQGFLDERQDDPTLREEVAQAHFFTGQITQAIDSPANALPHYQRAAETQQELSANSPDSAELAAAFGKTLNALGDASLRLGQLDQANEYFQRAIKVRDKLAKADPDDVEAARTLASSVMNFGFVYYLQGDFETAIERMRHAQAIRLAHTSGAETVTTILQRDLGMGYYNLALTYGAVEETQQSENNFLAAIAAFEQLLELDPADMKNRRKLAACHRMVGQLQSKLGNSAKAIEYYEQAQRTLAELRLRNPHLLDFTSDLAGVHLHLGLELAKQDQPDAALATLDQATELFRELIEQAETVPSFRRDLSHCLREAAAILATTGQHVRARKRLEESQGVLSQLVKEEPSNEQYTSELQLTSDELARVTISGEKTILEVDLQKRDELKSNERE